MSQTFKFFYCILNCSGACTKRLHISITLVISNSEFPTSIEKLLVPRKLRNCRVYFGMRLWKLESLLFHSATSLNITLETRIKSSTERAIGPLQMSTKLALPAESITASWPAPYPSCPIEEILLPVGLNPYKPVK